MFNYCSNAAKGFIVVNELTNRQIALGFHAMARKTDDPSEAGRLFEKGNMYFDLAKTAGESFNQNNEYVPGWGLERSDFNDEIEWEGYLDGGKTFGDRNKYTLGTAYDVRYRHGWDKRTCDILFQGMKH